MTPDPHALPEVKQRFSRIHRIASEHVRQCSSCGICAFAIDDHQRRELEARGWLDGSSCPACEPSSPGGVAMSRAGVIA